MVNELKEVSEVIKLTTIVNCHYSKNVLFFASVSAGESSGTETPGGDMVDVTRFWGEVERGLVCQGLDPGDLLCYFINPLTSKQHSGMLRENCCLFYICFLYFYINFQSFSQVINYQQLASNSIYRK